MDSMNILYLKSTLPFVLNEGEVPCQRGSILPNESLFTSSVRLSLFASEKEITTDGELVKEKNERQHIHYFFREGGRPK